MHLNLLNKSMFMILYNKFKQYLKKSMRQIVKINPELY